MAERSDHGADAEGAAGDGPTEAARAKIDALTQAAWDMRRGDSRRSNTLAVEARELAIEHGYTLGQARAARTLAMTIVDVDGIRTIFELAEEAKRLFDEVGEGAGRAASRDFLASLHEYTGDLGTGLEYALDALRIAREIDHPVRQGYALSNIGGIEAATGDVDAAIEHLEEALQFFEGAEDLRGAGTICSRLSKICLEAGLLDEAQRYADRCGDLAERTGETTTRLTAASVMAGVERARGRLAEAERLYRFALEGPWTTPAERNVVGAPTQLALGRLLTETGALDEAEVELRDVLARIEGDTVSIVTEASAREALAVVFEEKGDLSSALVYLRESKTLREQIASQDAERQLARAELRAALEAAKKDAEIHRLRYVELHAMQSKLLEAEKMALLGTLAAGTAHELNTPLGVVRSNLELSRTAGARLAALARENAELGPRAAKLASVLESCTEASEGALERLGAVAVSFSRFTELDQAERRAFDIREGLDSAMVLLEPTVSQEIAWQRRFAEVPAIEGWPREMNHALLTVLQNAAQAIDGEGVITAETRVSDGQVLVRIADTGRGMSAEQTANLFDVSWSEDGSRARMRLGLSAAYATVQRHGGEIDVESEPGEGTTVTFCLPIAST